MIKVTIMEENDGISNTISIESDDIEIINYFLNSKGKGIVKETYCDFPNTYNTEKLNRIFNV